MCSRTYTKICAGGLYAINIHCLKLFLLSSIDNEHHGNEDNVNNSKNSHSYLKASASFKMDEALSTRGF